MKFSLNPRKLFSSIGTGLTYTEPTHENGLHDFWQKGYAAPLLKAVVVTFESNEETFKRCFDKFIRKNRGQIHLCGARYTARYILPPKFEEIYKKLVSDQCFNPLLEKVMMEYDGFVFREKFVLPKLTSHQEFLQTMEDTEWQKRYLEQGYLEEVAKDKVKDRRKRKNEYIRSGFNTAEIESMLTEEDEESYAADMANTEKHKIFQEKKLRVA